MPRNSSQAGGTSLISGGLVERPQGQQYVVVDFSLVQGDVVEIIADKLVELEAKTIQQWSNQRDGTLDNDRSDNQFALGQACPV